MSRPDRNRQAQAAHKRRMRAEGFVRLCLWVSPGLESMLASHRRPGECRGRTIERLLLGAADPRPSLQTPPAPAGLIQEISR